MYMHIHTCIYKMQLCGGHIYAWMYHHGPVHCIVCTYMMCICACMYDSVHRGDVRKGEMGVCMRR